MSRCLLDASATLAWLFNEGGRGPKLAARMRQAALIVPWLWRLEVTNAVLVRERRRQITEAQGVRYLEILDSLGVAVLAEPHTGPLSELAQAARPHQLSAYDACYLESARRLDLPLLTTDSNLRRAATRIGLPLISAD